ncbi:CopZ family metallochaperone [Arhodomonas sp. AD133]|uniref:CopZ family metallochaperone n=1 Tax=Arhodomonas sp. AD133 TaxID=3415009 RepID=UPI003EBF18D6
MINLTVTGMTCGHCEKAVEEALGELPGVERVVKVSRADEEVVVEGDPDVDALIAAIKEEGYEARAQ